ncbi:MAG: hypothetical protein IKG93_03305 [Clostridiales bacterium]|nr:hypothetical protein [Clostridiales bacterium]
MSNKKYWFISLATVSVLSLILILTKGIVLETVDDMNVMYSIAGYKTGAPFWQLTFYNCLLAGFISFFYRITGAIQWYSVFMFLGIYLSTVAIMYTVLRAMKCTMKNLWICILIICGLYCTSFMYVMQRMQFTTTAGICGAAAVCLMYLYLTERKTSDLVISCVFILGSFLSRRMAGIFCIAIWLGLYGCYFFLEILGNVSKKRKMRKEAVEEADSVEDLTGKTEEEPGDDTCRQEKKTTGKSIIRSAAIIAVALILVGACRVGDLYVKRTMLNKDYMSYDVYRGKYQDYKKPPFNENVDLYASVGWDGTLYNCIANLIYIDEKINKENLKALVESPQFNPQYTLREGVMTFSELMNEEPSAQIAVVVMVFFAVLAFVFALHKKDYMSIFLIIYALCAWFVFVAYLSYEGRLPLRVLLLVTLPCLSLTCHIALKSADFSKAEMHLSAAVILPMLIALSFPSLENVYVRLRQKDKYSQRIMFAFEEYVMNHPENVYVHDYTICNFYNSYSAFHTYTDKKPTNAIVSGGSYTYTACYYEQLRVNGLSKLTGETFFEDNVYFVCDLNRRPEPTVVLDYLRARYDGVSYELVEKVADGDVGIFKFTKRY